MKIDELLKLYKSLFEEYKLKKDDWKARMTMYYNKFKIEAQSIKTELEDEFRVLIGVK